MALLSGCGPVDDLLGDGSTGSTGDEKSPSADERLLQDARADQRRVLADCLAVRAAQPQLRELLTPMVDHHRTHVELLGGEPSRRKSRRAPRTTAKALEWLRDVELKASRRRSTDAGRAQAGELARVLAGIAASQAQHGHLIDEARENR